MTKRAECVRTLWQQYLSAGVHKHMPTAAYSTKTYYQRRLSPYRRKIVSARKAASKSSQSVDDAYALQNIVSPTAPIDMSIITVVFQRIGRLIYNDTRSNVLTARAKTICRHPMTLIALSAAINNVTSITPPNTSKLLRLLATIIRSVPTPLNDDRKITISMAHKLIHLLYHKIQYQRNEMSADDHIAVLSALALLSKSNGIANGWKGLAHCKTCAVITSDLIINALSTFTLDTTLIKQMSARSLCRTLSSCHQLLNDVDENTHRYKPLTFLYSTFFHQVTSIIEDDHKYLDTFTPVNLLAILQAYHTTNRCGIRYQDVVERVLYTIACLSQSVYRQTTCQIDHRLIRLSLSARWIVVGRCSDNEC